MKLVFTSYSSSPEYDQPESWLKRIATYTGILESLGKNHTVIGIERINYEGEYKHKGGHYFFIRQTKKVKHFPLRIHRLIKQLKPDTVFINGFIFPWQIMQLRWMLGKTAKLVVIHRSEKPFTGFRKYLQKFASGYVDAFLFISAEFGQQWVEKGNIKDRKKIYEVLHASSVFSPGDKVIARASLSISGSPVFLWVGRLNDNKDPLTVLKAFSRFLAFQPGAVLYMIYRADELLEEVTNMINQDEKLRQAVCRAGKLPHAQLQSWYNAADFIISGSHYEGGGIAVCEAMSCGCIPVVTNIISFRKMTGPGKCGLLYEPGDQEDLLKVLLKSCEIDMEREREKVLQQFKEELSFEAIAGKIDRVIRSL